MRKISNQRTKQRTYRPTKSTNRAIKTTKTKTQIAVRPICPCLTHSHSSPSFPPLISVPPLFQLPSFLPILKNVFCVCYLGSHCLFATCSVDKCYSFRWNLKETYRKNWRQGNIPRNPSEK